MDPLLQEFFGTSTNEYPVTNKTEDEIKRLTLEEDMPELKRAMHILYRGQSFQKSSVYRNLHNILLEPDSFSKIIPLVADGISSQNEELQVEFGKSLIKIMNGQTLEKSQLLDLFRITMVVATVWNQNVIDTWVLVFHEILKRVPYNAISMICEASIVGLSEQSQHPVSKYAAARLIGFIAEQGIKPNEPLFDKARFLCQDSEVEVRKIMAQEVILKICRHVGTSLTENKYLEKILELCYDSKAGVKLAAIDSLIEALDILSTGYKKTKILPVLLEMMNSVNEDVTKKMSFLVGKIMHKLEKIVLESSGALHQLESILKEWIAHPSIEIRKNIVYNIPYLIKIFENKAPLKEIYIQAAKDTNSEIRIIAMSSFHEIVKNFGFKEAQTSLREIFEAICKEEDIQILEKVVPHMNGYVPLFQAIFDEDEDAPKPRMSKVKESKDFKDFAKEYDTNNSKESTKVNSKENLDQKSYLDSLINLGTYLNSKHAWRLEVAFMNMMNSCIGCFSIKELGDAYVSFLFKEMARGIKDVRKTAIDSLIVYLKRNHYSNKTADIIKKLAADFQESTTFQNRLVFLEFYEQAAEHFSRQFFKTHALNEKALAIACDKVAEVKKKFLENAIVFKRMLLHEDKTVSVQLDEAISKNGKDKNKFISQLAKQTAKDLSLLTPLFFEDFLEEDEERIQKEDRLREREKEELEMLKRKQQEELFKSRPDNNFHVLNSLLLPGRKSGKKYTWSEAYSAKLPRSGQAATLILDDTPKGKLPTHPVSLPAIKSQKNTVSIPQLTVSKDVENKPKTNKSKIFSKPPLSNLNPIESATSKKKPGSFSMPCKERQLNVGIHKPERKASREKTVLTEPTARQSVENKISKAEALERVDKHRVRVPTIRKKF